MNFLHRLRKYLIIAQFDGITLALHKYRAGKMLDKAVFLLRETPQALLAKNVCDFIGRESADVIAVIPRSDILQKDFSLAGSAKMSVKAELDLKLNTLLPFSIKEMAWGIWMEPQEETMEGVLMAAPEQKMKKALSFLNDLGLDLGNIDIISEDQALLWAALNRKQTGPALLLDCNPARVLCVFFKNGRLVFSQTFPGFAEDVLTELSLKMLESGVRPEKIFIAGNWTDEQSESLSRHFGSGPERLFAAAEGAFAPVEGAAMYGKFPCISLLPKEEKAERRRKFKKNTLFDIGLTAAALCFIFIFYQWSGLSQLNRTYQAVRTETDNVADESAEARKIIKSLDLVHDAQASKQHFLGLLKGLAEETPASIHLNEIRNHRK